MLLIVFLGVWIAFAVLTRRKLGWSITLSVGGGFIVSCLALIILVPGDSKSKAPPPKTSQQAQTGCKPVDTASLWLPNDKKFAQDAFLDKARRLNASGLCVVEGSFGKSHQNFYITVTPTGDIRDSMILYFSYEELLK